MYDLKDATWELVKYIIAKPFTSSIEIHKVGDKLSIYVQYFV